jgi:hypothetical protein
MAWAWSKRGFEQTIIGIIKAPHLFAYGSIFWAFFAGFELRDLILRARNHSADAFDYLNGPLFLLVALLWTYAVVKAIQRVQGTRSLSASSHQTEGKISRAL